MTPTQIMSSPSGDGNLSENVSDLEALVREVDKMDIPGRAFANGWPNMAGQEGEEGPTGAQGPPGPVGPAGAQGPQGQAGPAGEDGETGPQGPTGQQGQAGQPGQIIFMQAEDGEEGPQGPTGQQGPAGQPGQIIFMQAEDGESNPPIQAPPFTNWKQEICNWLYPVGSIYTSTLSTNPGTLLGIGTWTAFAAGQVMVGLDAGQTEFDTVEETGGEKTHTLTTGEMPAHTHTLDYKYATNTAATAASTRVNDISNQTGATGTAATGTSNSTGSGTAHNNLQPYIVVYAWKRTA